MDYSNSKDKFNEVATDPFIPSLVSLEQTPLSDSADASGQIPYMAEGIRLTGDVSDQEVEEEDERDVVGDCNDNSSSGILSQVDPEMIRMATQEAVDAAVAMKRSDSILSMESNETSSNRSGSLIFDDPLNISTRCSNASAKYMEAASFEATMLSSGIHRVLPHGKVQRGEQDSLSDIVRLSRLSTQESEEIESANGDDSLSTSIRRSSERCAFKNASKFSSDSVPLLETIVSTDRKEWLGEEATDISLLEILKSCDLATPKILLSKVHPLEVCLLHLVFENFCSPPLSVDSVQAIFKKQKNQSGLSVSLPVDIIIEKPSQTLVKLLGTPLLRLPEEWAMCFLRILLRLLTNESDAEYEEAILNSCPWYDETFRATDLGRPRLRTASTASLNNQSSFSDQSIHRTGNEAKKSNQMYSIVRLRGSWNSAVKQVLEVLDVVLNDSKYTYLAGPMTRLLGLLCTSGVSVMELQKILALATDTKASPYTQLLLVRTLQTAAAGASRPLMGKADPKTFFSFTFGTGISRTINLDKTSWPFRNDFGMALWFRVEYFHGSSTLLRVTNECGNGTEVSLLPLSTNGTGSGSATVSVIVVSVLEGGKPVESVKVNTCIVHERVWYHIAVRHTRSRLKGMFSLNSREQLSIILDGKHMATESLKFPLIKDSSSKSLTLTFGDNFDGQAGALYVFHSNVSDATLKALHDITSEITNLQSRRTTVEWDTRQGEIVRKSKVLDLGMRRDDIEDVVLSYRVDGKQNHHFTTVVDLEEEDESLENGPLSKNSFNQRLYLVWDPRRTVGATVLELHSGAHARLDPENVQQWTLEGVQDVISSLGGVQSVLPILWCLFSGNVENGWLSQPNDDNAMLQRCLMCSAVPDALLLLSSLVKSHNENAREMLRCGAIDLLEQALQSNKHLGLDRGYCTPAPSLVGSACMFPTLSARLVSAILEFRSTCSHYIGLETKVFSRLVFNPPLWLDGPCQGIAMFSDYLPSLSIISRRFPEKIRACVGVKGLVKVIIDLIEVNENENSGPDHFPLFDRNIGDLDDLRSHASSSERWYVCEILFTMVFQVMALGSTVEEVSLLVNSLSKYLETEWEMASLEVSNGALEITRSGPREDRFLFSLRASFLILLLLKTIPSPPDFVRNLASACGGAQGGAAWILCTMVNSYCDRIRAIGVRCFVAYLELTGRHPDQPINLEDSQVPDLEKVKSYENRSLQENTMSLISNVGHGLMNSNVGKGLAAIGPSIGLKSQTSSKLTPRVAYKLLWHLLKSHRYRIDKWTQGSLVAMVYERKQHSLLFALSNLKEKFLAPDDFFKDSLRIDWTLVESTMHDFSVPLDASIRGDLGLSTIMRLLRFLPDDYLDQWLSYFVNISARNTDMLDCLSTTQDWQPCLFQLSSELTERLVVSTTKQSEQEFTEHSPHHVVVCGGDRLGAGDKTPENEAIFVRLNLALELHSILLGNLFRHGEARALGAIEDAASLQRVYLNGQKVLLLILTKLFSNLASFGVLPVEKITATTTPSENYAASIMLKQSAKLITDTILSNTSKGMSMPAAVDSWRCVRHLIALVVAMVTRLGFGVAELLESSRLMRLAIDETSKGLYGIRLPDGDIGDVTGKFLAQLYFAESRQSKFESDVELEKNIDRRICVNLAAQTLAFLDVFIFPDSLVVTHPATQLHGLALVRNTESRIGGAQGPLLASLVRLSIFLMNQLEPCSVSLLQCSSRLRCFLHWILELVRESEALEGYSAAFNKLTAPFDRLILAVVLQCQETLKRSQTLLLQLESPSSEIPFDSKDNRKKVYRRLIRVCIEVRECLVTVMEQRNDVLRACLSGETFKALQYSLEMNTTDTEENTNALKEVLVHKLLGSDWVIRYHGMFQEGDVQQQQIDRGEGLMAIENLVKESREISGAFEKSLSLNFEKYLESQRKWAETGAVRDLEYEGDTVLKRLSRHHTIDLFEFSKEFQERSQAADWRWRSLSRKVVEIWMDCNHWKLRRETDALGRRIVLARNRCFDAHEEASYDLLMGREREREEREREERRRKKQELVDLMKRNAEAFVPRTEISIVEEDEEREQDETDDLFEEASEFPPSPKENQPELSFTDAELGTTSSDQSHHTFKSIMVDADAWAKAFIWSESESIVARFDSVMVVSLQYVVEGNLLLTTHSLYFHQTGKEINTVTKDTVANNEPTRQFSVDHDRRWRLSRLKEVHGRRYMLRAQALELFFTDCNEVFLNFPNGFKERNRFYAKLRNSCKVPMLCSPKSLNPRTIYKKSNLTELWRKRRISNFEYIMALNRMAGRTFNDIAQYPVFPWILSNYTSEKIDLTDSRVYRDLTKPVGALNPDRLAQLLERFNELEQFGFAENERFLYGSHYSSPGVVLHFLIRQEPFTSMAIDLQSGRFDCPDRLFFDIAESWKSCNTSSSDVKELIPEFFTLPEMFLNTNKFPLGKTQKGRRVDDVGLPPWTKGSAHEFVRIHRLALESEYVSRNLHHWVDLVFGYKQRGQGAEAAHNIFHHLSYEGAVDLDKITDKLDREAAEAHIQNFGQTPCQLLVKEPHPHRFTMEESWVPLINNISSTVRLRCHTPGKQFGGKKDSCGSAIKISVQVDTITVVYSELKIGTFRWYPKATKNRLKPEKLRSLLNRAVSNSRTVMKRGSAAPQAMEDKANKYSVGNWSFAITLGGYEKEQLRRKALMPSRLVSAKDALYTDSASLILSCGYWDNSIKAHSTAAWKLECVDTGGHRGPIRCLTVDSEGAFMVSGGEDCTVRVWVVDYPDMAIASSDGYIQTALGHPTDGEQILNCCHVLWGHDTPITCVDLSSDLDVTVSGSAGGKVCVHSLRRGEFIRAIQPATKTGITKVAVAKLALDKHGRMVVHMVDGMLHTFTINGVCLCAADAGELIHDMVITGEVVITGGDRCHVYIRDLVTLKILSGLDLYRHGPIKSITLTPDELNPSPQHLFIGSDDGMISIVDREDIMVVTGGR